MQHSAWVVLSWMALSACGDSTDPDPPEDAGGMTDRGDEDSGPTSCSNDGECDDGSFCNGTERCMPGASDADEMGCVETDESPCVTGQSCDESADRCVTECAEGSDADGDGSDAMECGGDDCDDSDDGRFPGNPEVCDDIDQDCDPATLGERDQDGDGAIDARCCNGTGSAGVCGDDCSDVDRGISPNASEVCDTLDNDCDGMVDENVSVPGFVDEDGDLHGDPTRPMRGCAGLARISPLGDDCDDTVPARHPAQIEVCNLQDDDCDGEVDEDTADTVLYRDADGDGFGSPASGTRTACVVPTGYSVLGTDCDDDDDAIHPGAAERCNGVDDDCDRRADFAIGVNDTEDDDLDGAPDAACGGSDCDDRNPDVRPGAPEIEGDGVDNDCDEAVDDSCRMGRWLVDVDGDGFGDDTVPAVMACEPQAGRVLRGGDCDDSDPEKRPGAREVCNEIDDNCDEDVDGELADRACSRPAALGRCDTGTCRVQLCQLGSDNCNLEADDGCEITLESDPENCGMCAHECGFGPMSLPICIDYVCSLMCASGFADCDDTASNGCEIQTSRDVAHCGACLNRCPTRPNASPTCVSSMCGLECETGYGNCDGLENNGCEIDTQRDVDHCGRCDTPCTGTGEICIEGVCQDPVYPSDGNEGDFMPTVSMQITPGIHQFRRIVIPFGVVVTTSGSGVLELRASEDVSISGTINVSGGRGGNEVQPSLFDFGAGGGGTTGSPVAGHEWSMGDPQCVPELLGRGGSGAMGGDAVDMASYVACGAGGVFGGGAGGHFTSVGGGGGGGYAGGGGGGSYQNDIGGAGASHGTDVGGMPGGLIGGMSCQPGRGGNAPAPYAGGHGGTGECTSGGGGGSIGASAAGDLAVATTFRPGSAGGGGGGGYYSAGAGGGGAGGALRISSPTRITVAADGALLARGGAGGRSPNASGGGGGSGGVIYLAAPSLTIAGTLSTSGGAGGDGFGLGDGGTGGMGRVRLSVLESECDIDSASLLPPAAGVSCAPSPTGGVAGTTYIGRYPL